MSVAPLSLFAEAVRIGIELHVVGLIVLLVSLKMFHPKSKYTGLLCDIYRGH